MSLTLGQDVLLFFEDRDRDTFLSGDRKLRRALRKTIALARPNRQRISGFEMSFRLLHRALTKAGHRVHVNDFALARRNPDFPIGLCGYSHILEGWNLPNPAVIGPGIYDHPKQNIKLLGDRRFASYIVFCEWMRVMFAKWYDGDHLYLWFGGIDVADWPAGGEQRKDIDVLVYDKIRWHRDTLEPSFRQPILDELDRRGLRVAVVRYGAYTLATYRRLLERSRSMLFLCEHETQGMAYQEAMASNLPVLAWDPGSWVDPNCLKWESEPVPTTSVPYFSNQCGVRFSDLSEFPAALEHFLDGRSHFAPRHWVAENLTPERSASLYLDAYYNAAGRPVLAPSPRESPRAMLESTSEIANALSAEPSRNAASG
jgi:hypothetical protein